MGGSQKGGARRHRPCARWLARGGWVGGCPTIPTTTTTTTINAVPACMYTTRGTQKQASLELRCAGGQAGRHRCASYERGPLALHVIALHVIACRPMR